MEQRNSKKPIISPQAAEELLKYKKLLDDGLISQTDYDGMKARLLDLEIPKQVKIAEREKEKAIKAEQKAAKRAANAIKLKKRLKLWVIIGSPCLAVIIGLSIFLGLWFVGYIPHLKYELNEDGASYSVVYMGSTYSNKTEIIIPSKHNGNPVTSIGDRAFKDCASLVSITIPDSVTSIGYEAFNNCTSLKSVIFENTTGWSTVYLGSIASSDLENPATAATYLAKYCYYPWKRK